MLQVFHQFTMIAMFLAIEHDCVETTEKYCVKTIEQEWKL